MNPSLLEYFCKDGQKDEISAILETAGWSPENPNINGYQLNTIFNQIFSQLNYLKSKGFSFWQDDKPYVATANDIDIVRQNNKIYFAKQNSNTDLLTPKAPATNPDFWGVLYDLDKSLDTTYALKTELLLKADIEKISNIFEKPNKNVLFTKFSATSFIIPIGFTIRVGTTLNKLTSSYTLSLDTNLDTGVKIAGTDYYVYAKADSTFYISANKAITADRLIGGFHYSLIPEAEALTGNKTEADMVAIRGINQYSFWDLKFRPVANPEGMVFVNGRWYDIYLLNSEHITNGSSKAGAVIAGGVADTTNYRAIPKIPLEFGGDGATNYGKFTWFQACEIAKSHAKELIPYSEFPTIAYGVTEKVSSQTNAYEVVIGKIEHYSNLTSKYGIEQATGTQWLWGADVGGNRSGNSTAWAWRTGLTDNRGDIYSLHANHITAVLLGAYRGNGVHAGSRASNWYSYVWNSSWDIGSRFACDHLELV
ncbi:MAG: hypothetical protein COB61_005700 [Thiotrichales bacterium]|nr:hypothetical protein [Thiotrichales bacterium]